MNVLRKFNYIFSRRQKAQTVGILVMIVIGSALELIGVSSVLPFINSIMQPEKLLGRSPYKEIYAALGMTDPVQFILLVIAALIVIYVLKNLYLILMYRMQYQYIYSNLRALSTRMMKSYLSQPYSFFLSRSSSELLRNINQDVADFFGVIQALVQLTTEGLTVLVLVVYLFIQDKSLTIAMGAALAILLLGFLHVYKKHLGRMGDRNRYYEAQVNKWIQQAFGGIKEVKVMNREDFFFRNYDKAYQGRVKSEYTYHTYISIPKPVMEASLIGSLLTAIALKLLHGTDAKYFIPTISIFAVAAIRLLPSFNRITEYLGTISYQSPAVNAIYHDLKEIDELNRRKGSGSSHSKTQEKAPCGNLPAEADRSPEDRAEEKPSSSVSAGGLHTAIRVKDLSFHYPSSDKLVLDHVNLTIHKNTSVALIGQSGAGKTTLADLILGVLEPTEGAVLADDRSIQDNLQGWHRTVGYIPQQIYLMDDTIADNIAFGVSWKDIDREKLNRAVERSQLGAFIRELPDGLETEVGERGVRLSGGQRQRIGIARALYNEPEVLVLDEATSALDNETETAVMESIDALHGEMTLIIIAHRLSTIRNCDVVYRVGDGKALQETNPNETS